MTPSKLHRRFTNGASPALLAFACAALGAGCSADYPLGDLSRGDLPLSSSAKTASARVADHAISPLLTAPDVTMTLDAGLEGFASPATIANVGDLDGDGLPEVAIIGYDTATNLAFVQLRYGAPRLSDATNQLGWRESGAILTLGGSQASDEPVGLLAIGQVSPAGDVDGDGYADLLISTAYCSPTQDDEGVYLVYGGPRRLEGAQRLRDVGVRFVPPQRTKPDDDGSASCGGVNSGRIAGDLDGDGLSDLVFVEPPNYDNRLNPLPDGGTQGIYVFYGNTRRFENGTSWAQADAQLSTSGDLSVSSLRDVNGDGRTDVLVGWSYAPWQFPDGSVFPSLSTPLPSYFLPGSAQRLNGTLPIASVGTELQGAFPPIVNQTNSLSDLDGDGLSDVLLQGKDGQGYLFYGAPALFQNGVDLDAADATFTAQSVVQLVGDRDGDGDAELMWSIPQDGGNTGYEQAYLFTSGQHERLSGDFTFPSDIAQSSAVPHFDDPQRVESPVFPAGDLDGDGVDDLFGYSTRLVPTPDGSGLEVSSPELHIHYGTRAGAGLQDAPH
jgi:hypothetical protein